MFNFRQACDAMVRQQLRTYGVVDEALLRVIRETPRELFVPSAYRDFAYADLAIPLANGQQMLVPEAEATILQALALQPTDHVLEIGTGSGYFTALMAQLAGQITSVDIFQEFIDAAKTHPILKKFPNIQWQCGDMANGPLNADAIYDAIIISGGLHFLPEAFLAALRPGGRLVAIVGTPTVMEVCVWKQTQEFLQQQRLFETVTPYLVNARNKDEFKF